MPDEQLKRAPVSPGNRIMTLLGAIAAVIDFIFTACEMIEFSLAMGASIIAWLTYLWMARNVLGAILTLTLVIALGYGGTRIYKLLRPLNRNSQTSLSRTNG